MAWTDTRFFGRIEHQPEAVITFPYGIPGFEEHTQFLPITRPGTEPVIFLQSLLQTGLCFVTLPVSSIVADYELNATPEDLREIGFAAEIITVQGPDALCLAILTIQPGKPPTANLLSPIVVNLANNQGMQLIRPDTEYSHQYPLQSFLTGAACS